MGYRSDVAIAITGDKEVIDAIVAKMKLTMPEILSMDYWQFDFEDERIVFTANDVKWYDGYEDVDKITAWYKEVEKMYDEAQHSTADHATADPMATLCGKFVRVGEEMDDNKQEYFGDDYLDFPEVIRHINWG
jgi:hypothetical protein